MKGFFLTRLLKWVGGSLDGYKTIIGGVGLILTGLTGVLGKMFPDAGLPDAEIDFILTQFSLGFVALGLGGKGEKLLKK